MQSFCSDCPVSSCVSLTSYNTIYLHVSVYTIFYLFTFLIAAQKILLIELAKASKHLQPYCAQQVLVGGFSGDIVPSLAADGGSLLLAVQQQGDGNEVRRASRKRNLTMMRMMTSMNRTRLEKSMYV